MTLGSGKAVLASQPLPHVIASNPAPHKPPWETLPRGLEMRLPGEAQPLFSQGPRAKPLLGFIFCLPFGWTVSISSPGLGWLHKAALSLQGPQRPGSTPSQPAGTTSLQSRKLHNCQSDEAAGERLGRLELSATSL